MSNLKLNDLQHYDVVKRPQPNQMKLVQTTNGDDYEPARIRFRALAIFLDALIIGVITALCSGGIVYGLSSVSLVPQGHIKIVMGFTEVILGLFYWIGLTLKFGATPGKKIMGLRIINYHDPSQQLTFFQLFMREILGKLCSTLTFMIGYVMAFFRNDRRTLHDMISKTRVVKFRS